jgi:hypothetical protein
MRRRDGGEVEDSSAGEAIAVPEKQTPPVDERLPEEFTTSGLGLFLDWETVD